jgi:hypothetical protein
VDEFHDVCRLCVLFQAAGPPLFRHQETPGELRVDGQNPENC